MEGPDETTNPCAICLGGMRAGGGQATFTAECSHTFHFTCICASVAHGNLLCPICSARWRDLPFLRPAPVPPPPPPPLPPVRAPRDLLFVRPTTVPPPNQPRDLPSVRPTTVPPPPPPVPAHFPQLSRSYPVEPVILIFDDDEQVEPASRIPHSQPAPGAASSGAILNTHTEYPEFERDWSSDSFAMLVHLKAPGMIDTDAAPRRAPLDLVTVLDVSDSMSGQNLALLKQAMRFIINNLGPDDRLSVVSFSSKARRVTRLARMTHAGKASCVGAVNFLMAGGGSNIAEGLRTAAKVLDERRQRNAVSSVLLLSGGQDTYTMVRRPDIYEELVPPSFKPAGGEWSAPVHTFGFGYDHDPAAMHVIAEVTGGTFSFIENEAVIQDAFEQCIGPGLLSVVVREARMAIACVHPGVRVVSVKSGRYESHVDEDGRAASIRVGELYADEERRFLLFLAVPRAEESDSNDIALVKVVFNCRDAATGLDVSVAAEDVVVGRPDGCYWRLGIEMSAEVEQGRVLLEAAEDIAAARSAAERGAHEEAVEILENRQRLVAQLEASWYGDPMMVALGAELRGMRRRVSSQQSYMRAGMSTHTQQQTKAGDDAHASGLEAHKT